MKTDVVIGWVGGCVTWPPWVSPSPRRERCEKKQKEEQRRKSERLTNLRAKWDGNGKRDRRDWKGGRVAVV